MKYMGSKNRHAKELLPIILNNRQPDQWYVEPFVGGFNMIDKVIGKRIGSDNNEYIVSLFKALKDGWEPPELITECEYKNIQRSVGEYPKHLVGYVAISFSYGAKWFGGYRREKAGQIGDMGNMIYQSTQSKKSILKQKEAILGIDIYCEEYYNCPTPPNSIIYCDPPYADTTKYKSEFDHIVFWNWVRCKVKEGHSVFISEYNAPDDFTCIWEKKVNNTLVANTGSKQGIEKLFIHSSQSYLK